MIDDLAVGPARAPATDPSPTPPEPDRRSWSEGPEERLLLAAGDGDQAAFAEFHDLMAPMVASVARRMLHDPHLAAECQQDIMCELWRVASRYDPTRAPARAWAMTIAHRRAVDRVRSEQAARERDDRYSVRNGDPVPEPMDDDVVDKLHLHDERARVREALDSLSEGQREAIVLAYFGGMTYSEVAAYLGAPLGTVKTRIRDGLNRLRDLL